MLYSTVLISAAALFSVACAAPNEKRALAEVIVNCKVPKTAAFTLDDGPYLWGREIGDILVAAGAKGTFFLAGNTWSCIYNDDNIKRIKYLHEQGHQIGSHTWNHLDLSLLSRDEVNYEMRKTEDALLRIVGLKPAFMRPPFGRYNNLVREVVAERGQKIAYWDVDTEDSWGATVERSKVTIDEAISRNATTLHILAHETYETTAYEILPYAIQELQAAGYKLVTVAECLGEEPYQWTQEPGTKNETWVCGNDN